MPNRNAEVAKDLWQKPDRKKLKLAKVFSGLFAAQTVCSVILSRRPKLPPPPPPMFGHIITGYCTLYKCVAAAATLRTKCVWDTSMRSIDTDRQTDSGTERHTVGQMGQSTVGNTLRMLISQAATNNLLVLFELIFWSLETNFGFGCGSLGPVSSSARWNKH